MKKHEPLQVIDVRSKRNPNPSYVILVEHYDTHTSDERIMDIWYGYNGDEYITCMYHHSADEWTVSYNKPADGYGMPSDEAVEALERSMDDHWGRNS